MAKPKTAAKKSAIKKTPARKSSAKNTRRKKSSTNSASFKLAPETLAFNSFKITEQTIYWLVFALAVLFLGLWILNVNMKVQELYDQIDQNRIMQLELDERLNRARESQSTDR